MGSDSMESKRSILVTMFFLIHLYLTGTDLLLSDPMKYFQHLLPPASKGWGKVMFSVCSHLGVPSQVPSPFSRLWSQVLSGRVSHYLVPCPFWGGRVPHSWSGGRYPTTGQGYPTSQDLGTLTHNWDTPSQDWGSPPPGQVCCGWYVSCGFPQEDFLVFELSSPKPLADPGQGWGGGRQRWTLATNTCPHRPIFWILLILSAKIWRKYKPGTWLPVLQ